MPIECPARVGKYTLLRHLSAGGMADLYEARLMGIENFRRSIAIKVVRKPPGLSDDEAIDFINMFVDEARVCGQLTHANIAQVYELGKVSDLPYMAMELVEGHSLSQVRRKSQADEVDLPLPFIAYVLAHTAMGLDYAHRRVSLDGEPLNIVHRDVSPDNILISYSGEVKLIDFGVAHARQSRRKTEDGGLRGKLPYMAPEQARQEPVDARADIFGLGAVLYELVAGRRLYLSSGMELFIAARDGLLPDFDRTLAGVAPELRAIIERCVAVDREARFASAAEVAKSLEPFMIRDRNIFGGDDAARIVAERYPDLPNRRRAQADVAVATPSAEIQTQVLKTFDSEFYKRATQQMDPIDPKALSPAAAQAAVSPLPVAPAAAASSKPSLRADPTVPATPALAKKARQTAIDRYWRGRSRNDKLKTLGVVAALILVLVTGSLVAQRVWAPPPHVAVTMDRGYVSFVAQVEGRVQVSIDGRKWQRIPDEPLALSLGTHRVRFRHRVAKGKVRNASQSITVTERHTRERPLRISFR